jgi:hypothetical protein
MSDLMISVGGVRYRREEAIAKGLLTKDGKTTKAGNALDEAHAESEKARQPRTPRNKSRVSTSAGPAGGGKTPSADPKRK